ncbi:flagellar biosynthesis regulator FlaF [Sulfitobacter mediterraneus]|uniref:flagellar biosynthesis regulator FlaF n=1 Tax=Sulfitobacter mediterraneus TaxID=83219 RepID=UPI00193363D9|nr:flagellar biosynthesis regulator FlaF [Sulfitobacter mediterraneus]MBM1308769.1 flagellar biosynthesis regulator FlaF [Sulfitobacter mediterraneus]MBM1312654.1 flagellar biosynthesis regulator FlaF [Sulfitobacter mediterraneus]MBM1321036.1 flagellar biosynthesis regulator FlaF [Sulfitobacter mediterraneus]MBM1324923.1 flagellar biosynthesis regulator FlaF [Sulfitobacter mediterraneus]MBM1396270.1 flagellar biosynthesis regulator FlaF [Sulfitobacter mediterraneus]
MNATDLAQRAYAPTAAPTKSHRSVEYEVIARITFRLKQAIETDKFPQLLEALHENRKLWRTLAVEVADDNNLLPSELRARIFYLAEFTDIHTSKVIAKQATPVALLEINTAILRGLKQTGASS